MTLPAIGDPTKAAADGDGDQDIDLDSDDEDEDDLDITIDSDDDDDDGDDEDEDDDLDEDGNPRPKVITVAEHEAALTAAKAEAEQAVAERMATEARQRVAQEAESQAAEALRNTFPKAESDLDEILDGLTLTNSQGQRHTLADALEGFTVTNARGRRIDALTFLSEAVKMPFASFNADALKAATAIIERAVQDEFSESVPKDRRDAFIKAAEGKPVLQSVKAYVEAMAPATAYVKNLSLEDAEKVSAKLKGEVEARVKAGDKAGRDKGKRDVPGDPNSGRSAGGTRSKSYQALELGYGEGTNSDVEDAEYLRQAKARGAVTVS